MRLARASLVLQLLTWSIPSVAQDVSILEEAVRLFEAGRFDEADDRLKRILRDQPSLIEARFYLGRVGFAMERYGEAAKQFDSCVRAQRGVARYHFWAGRAHLEAAQQASIFTKLGHAQRARDGFEAAVRLDPEDAEGRTWLAMFYHTAPGVAGGNKREAWRQVEAVRVLDPQRARRLAGTFSWREGRLAEALGHYEAVTAADSGVRAQDFYSLGRLYQETSRYEPAFGAFEQALARDSAHLAAHYQLGRTSALWGQQRDRGRRALAVFLASQPGDKRWEASGHWYLGELYRWDGDSAAAAAEYEAALKLDPKHDRARKALDALRPSR